MASTVLHLSAPLPLLNFLHERTALRSFIAIRAIDEFGSQMLNVAIAWYMYVATRDPMSLAYVGLIRFLPNIAMALLAGHAADRLDRRRIIGFSLTVQALCLAILGAWAANGKLSAGAVYLLLLVTGAAQAFSFPAMSAMQPQLVSPAEFPRAVAITSTVFQICTLAGPAVGGLIYALIGPRMFVLSAALYVVALAQVRRLATVSDAAPTEQRPPDESPLGGIRYIRSNRLLFSVISLDLFAVLLGGVTALLPIYAKDILAVGPAGLGWLRCPPGIGAAIVGFALARRTIRQSAGRLMLACVAGFGSATVVFAISTNFWLSLAALIGAGAFDMVSMVIRQTLVQVSTPDAMRGRVSAVQWVFVGASSELGEFESGATAALFGAVPAALLGGVGTLAVVALWTRIFPELSRADMLVTENGHGI